jgi:hypothetical protein
MKVEIDIGEWSIGKLQVLLHKAVEQVKRTSDKNNAKGAADLKRLAKHILEQLQALREEEKGTEQCS